MINTQKCDGKGKLEKFYTLSFYRIFEGNIIKILIEMFLRD